MPHRRAERRLGAVLLLGSVVGGCLPDGPDGYRGPRYAVAPRTLDASLPVPTEASVDDATLGPLSEAGAAPTSEDARVPDAQDAAPPSLAACAVRVTSHAPPGEFANAYVCAIWIEDDAGKLVRTLAYYAATRARYLYAYQRARADAPIDVTTQATINRTESKLAGRDAVEHALRWALDDATGQPVTGVAFTLRVETSSDNGQGPVVDVPLRLDAGPLDLRAPDTGNLTGLSVRCE